MTIAVDGNPKTIQEIAKVAFDREQVEIPGDLEQDASLTPDR